MGKDWLKARGGKDIKDYRQNLMSALEQARDKYVKRLEAEGRPAPAEIKKPRDKTVGLATVDPKAPDFSKAKSELSKLGGSCLSGVYKRYFIVDQENFQYFAGENDARVKKSYPIRDTTAIFHDMQVFNQARRTGPAAEKGDDYNWTQTNMRYRVGVLLPNRQKGGRVSPIFYYTTDLHEAKFLQVNINLYGDKYRNDRMKDVIRLGEKIEKATRL